MILTGENRRTRRETCPSATLPNTNPTCTDLGANLGLRGEKPVTSEVIMVLTNVTIYESRREAKKEEALVNDM
jgi:hypothetical protein